MREMFSAFCGFGYVYNGIRSFNTGTTQPLFMVLRQPYPFHVLFPAILSCVYCCHLMCICCTMCVLMFLL